MKLLTFISAGAFILFSAFLMKKEASTQKTPLYNTKWSLKKNVMVIRLFKQNFFQCYKNNRADKIG